VNRRVLLVALVLVLLGGLLGAGLYVRSRPPVAPAVAPPTLAEPADNGWPELIRAATALDPRKDEIAAAYERPWNEQSRDTARLLADCRADLAAARAALAKDCLQPRPKDINQAFPELRTLRGLARLLVLAAREREQAGDVNGAAAAYADVLRLGTVAGRNGTVIHGLVAIAIASIVAPDLERCTGSARMTQTALARTARELDRALERGVKSSEAMAMEYVLQRKWLEDVAAGLQAPGATGPRGIIVNAFTVGPALRELDRNVGPTMQALKKPYWEPITNPPVYRTTLGQLTLVQPEGIRRKWTQRDAVLLGLRTHVAIQQYRLRHRALPNTLQALSPQFLPTTPVDPYDGKPFRYRREARSYVLYSVGEDGKDDGGKERFDPNTNRGDFVIWPWGRLYESAKLPASPPPSVSP